MNKLLPHGPCTNHITHFTNFIFDPARIPSLPFLEPERFSEVSQDGYINFSGAPVRMVKSTKKFSRERLTGMSFLAPHTYMFRKLGELGKGSFGVVEKVNFY
jgi:hypothetical protein